MFFYDTSLYANFMPEIKEKTATSLFCNSFAGGYSIIRE